jgi:hypothetical protein
MSIRFVAPFIGGLALGAAAIDATGTLVAMPRIVVAAFGIVCLVVSAGRRGRAELRSGTMTWLGAIAAGLTLALVLPKTPLPAPVITRSPGGSHAGDLFALLDALDRDPTGLLERSVTVTGAWTPRDGPRAATVSRRVMTCCAADAVSVGFDVEPARAAPQRLGSSIRVTGILGATLRDGELRYVIRRASVMPAAR